MPTIVRRSHPLIIQSRREILSAITWRVRADVWHPPTDVYETDDSLVVKMEIAGMRDEDLEVAVEGSRLRISGSRSDTLERKAYYQMEIPFGRFSVNIELPVPVNLENARAEYRDGFLTIQLPKEK